MLKRRSILKAGAAGLAGALVNVPAGAAGAGRFDSRNSLSRVVYDQRFQDALVFAREFASLGVRTSGIRGDVASLWYEDLRSHLSQERAPVAGLTNRIALFCLEELMRDVGMKTRFRVDHMIHETGFVDHRAVGPTSLVRATQNLPRAPGFGRAMAILASYQATNEPSDIAVLKRSGPFSPSKQTALVSWIIA